MYTLNSTPLFRKTSAIFSNSTKIVKISLNGPLAYSLRPLSLTNFNPSMPNSKMSPFISLSVSIYSSRLPRVTLYRGGCAIYTKPPSIRGFICRYRNVKRSVRIWQPSTSASHIRMILWYRSFSKLNSSPTPVPRAVIMVRISSLLKILSRRDFSTFKIFPFKGRMA